MESLIQLFQNWLISQGIMEQYSLLLAQGSAFVLLTVISALSYVVVNGLLLNRVHHFAEKSPTNWDNIVVKHGVLKHGARFVPLLIMLGGIHSTVDTTSIFYPFIMRGMYLLMILLGIWMLQALLEAGRELYELSGDPDRERPPINAIVSGLHFVVVAGAAILALGVLLNLHPAAVMGTLGTISVLTAIFLQKPLQRFWSGFELERNRIVKVGDWIELPQLDVSGSVQKLSLSDVTILKPNKTLVNIPVELVRNSVIVNGSGIQKAGKRLLEKSIHIDASSIHFVTEEELAQAFLLPELKQFLKERENTKTLTNLTLFRAYVSALVLEHPKFSKEDGVMVRQLEGNAEGIPIQIRGYMNETAYVAFELTASDMLDLLLASVNKFGISLAQQPTNEVLKDFSSKPRNASAS